MEEATNITPKLLMELRARINIVALIQERVDLKRDQNYYVGLCPFHRDDEPLFFVNPELQLYKCKACHKTGDAFQFVQDMYDLDFVSSVKVLEKLIR
jgi:DNA primase